MADYIGATPQNPLLGLLYGGYDWMRSPQRTQQMQGLAGLLESTGIPKTIERMSYGEPLTNIGQANVPLLKPETAEAMMTVAPMAGPAARGAGRLVGSQINRAMMGEGGLLAPITPQPMYAVNLPKSISGRIGNITPESKTEVKNLAETFAEEINKLGFSAKVEHSGSKAGASSYINVTDPLTGRFLSKPIRISDHSKGAKESQGVIDILNPQDDFKKITDALGEMRGMGETLVFKQNKYANELIASGVKPKTAYQRAKTEITEIQPSFQYPQEQALKLAQERAALPVEQGGLGLLAENTPEMRAKAMGVQTDAYHGSKQDITGLFKAGYDDNLAFVTQSPEFASKWIGKGKLQSRIGAEDEIKAAEDLYRQIKYKHTDNELLSKLQGEEFNAAYDKMSVNARAEQQKEFGLRGNASGIYDTVYPVKVQANKTFNPETDMDVMSDFFKQNDIPPKLQELYAGGNYMMYETKPVVEYLKSKGYDSMRLRESTGDNYPTIAVFNPETVRSRFAAFDPFRKDVATATAMGVALPDLLAAEYNQQPQSAGLLYPLP